MNDIQFYNRKYSTVESLLNKTGKVNSSILRREWFNELDVVKKIYDESSELDVFGEVPIGDRISFIANKMKVEKCPFCGSGETYLLTGDQVIIKDVSAIFGDEDESPGGPGDEPDCPGGSEQ
jgi:hypothetical protein